MNARFDADKLRDLAEELAVANHFSIAGKRTAIDVVTIRKSLAGRTRLRFDKVALGFVAQLRQALQALVPDGQMLIVTVTAPIRQDSKTAAALEEKLRTRLARQSARVSMHETIHGNRIQVRLIKGVPAGAAKLIGFVHNPETDADALLGFVQTFIGQIGAAAERTTRKPMGPRCLVVVDGNTPARAGTVRHVLCQLGSPGGFEAMVLVDAQGRVESLGR